MKVSGIFQNLKPGTRGRKLARHLDDQRVATAILVSWGEEFRKWRVKNELIQKEAADYLQVSHDTIRSWESRQKVPHKFSLIVLRGLMRHYRKP
jgi:DNA-binding transcriptional regulator YiaG